MQIVGPGLGGEIVETASDLAELGREVARLERELLDHIDRRLRDGRGPADIVLAGGVLTLDLHAESVLLKPVDVGAVTVVWPSGSRDARGKYVERVRAANRA